MGECSIVNHCEWPLVRGGLYRCSPLTIGPCVSPEPLGGVKDLTVSDPTTSSLKVRWEPAEGNVRHYRLFYVPDVGGAEDMVRCSGAWTL